MFSDFWIGDGNQHKFWTKAEAINYLQRYATHFGVSDRIRFNAQVVRINPHGEGWQVQLASGDSLLTERVALAIGNNAIPNYPAWKESLTMVDYSHSQSILLRSP